MALERSPGAGSASRLGNYELLKELSGGGIGTTWIARFSADADAVTTEPVTILRLYRHLTKKAELAEGVLRGANTARNVRVPNVLAVLDARIDDGEVFVVSEYAEGEQLSALLTSAGADGIPLSVSLRIGLDVLRALVSAHTSGPPPLVHGELNPTHIRVGIDGVSRVGGFGVARAIAGITPMGAKSHDRLAYAAPERVKEMAVNVETPLDPRADLFAIGVVLWELLARQRLFASKLESAVIQKVLTAPIPSLTALTGGAVSAALNDAIRRALERDPAKRHESAAQMLEAIEAAAAGSVGASEEVAATLHRLASKTIEARRTMIMAALVSANSAGEARGAPPVSRRRGATLVGVASPLADDAGAPAAGALGRLAITAPSPRPRPSPPAAAVAAGSADDQAETREEAETSAAAPAVPRPNGAPASERGAAKVVNGAARNALPRQENTDVDEAWAVEGDAPRALPGARPRAETLPRLDSLPDGGLTEVAPSSSAAIAAPAPSATPAAPAPQAERAGAALQASRDSPAQHVGRDSPAQPAGRASPAQPAGRASPAQPAGRASPAQPAGRASPVLQANAEHAPSPTDAPNETDRGPEVARSSEPAKSTAAPRPAGAAPASTGAPRTAPASSARPAPPRPLVPPRAPPAHAARPPGRAMAPTVPEVPSKRAAAPTPEAALIDPSPAAVAAPSPSTAARAVVTSMSVAARPSPALTAAATVAARAAAAAAAPVAAAAAAPSPAALDPSLAAGSPPSTRSITPQPQTLREPVASSRSAHTPTGLQSLTRVRGRAASAVDRLGPGSTLGRYEILMPVAKGGMAAVWAARLQGTRGFQKIVAIKTMLPDVSDDPDFQSMFLDEARVAARIRHPNVAEILDLGEEDDVLYLVMEWVDGETVSTLQRAAKPLGGIPQRIVLRIASQMCAGLHNAHELRDDSGALLDLVHRDVSPANVLVSTAGYVKIVDFGVAKSKGRLHVTRAGGVIKGKTPYLSPEQLGGLPIDRRSDIFSLGALLYVLTTGLHPFRAETEMTTVENIALKNPLAPRELNEAIHPEFDKIIVRALEKDREQRFSTCAEMQRALDQVASMLGEPTTDEDVAAFVRDAIGDIQAKRAQELRDAIAAVDSTGVATSEPRPPAVAIPDIPSWQTESAPRAGAETTAPAAPTPKSPGPVVDAMRPKPAVVSNPDIVDEISLEELPAASEKHPPKLIIAASAQPAPSSEGVPPVTTQEVAPAKRLALAGPKILPAAGQPPPKPLPAADRTTTTSTRHRRSAFRWSEPRDRSLADDLGEDTAVDRTYDRAQRRSRLQLIVVGAAVFCLGLGAIALVARSNEEHAAPAHDARHVSETLLPADATTTPTPAAPGPADVAPAAVAAPSSTARDAPTAASAPAMHDAPAAGAATEASSNAAHTEAPSPRAASATTPPKSAVTSASAKPSATQPRATARQPQPRTPTRSTAPKPAPTTRKKYNPSGI